MLRDPFVVELAHTAPARTIDHAQYRISEPRKLAMLEHLLSRDGFRSAIVFARTKHRARRLAQKLDQSGHRVTDLQGNMSQPQRDRAMTGFREGRFDVLVATDIAARGIDVEKVSHVINYDVPNTPEAYTHRIGRTGRSEQSGQAFTFVTDADRSTVRAIEKKIGTAIKVGRLAGFEDAFTSRRAGPSRPSQSGRRPARPSGKGPRNGNRRRRARSVSRAGRAG
jgi:ATP-dependent RNA helicase RhlE